MSRTEREPRIGPPKGFGQPLDSSVSLNFGVGLYDPETRPTLDSIARWIRLLIEFGCSMNLAIHSVW
jgi:hypothetical protein